MKRVLTMVIALAVIFSGCFWADERLKGNGNIKTKRVDVSKFDHINVSDAIQVYVKQDSFYSAVIQADENLLEYIDIDATYRYHLNIDEASGYNLKPSKPIKVYVTSPMVRIFDASGASGIFSENLLDADDALFLTASGASNISLNVKAAAINADASGASTIIVKGNTKGIEIKASGASGIKCFDLTAENVIADAAGASNIDVMCNSSLKAEASGASTISYKGGATVTQNTSGASSLKKVD
jgi:Putative auto-transporter adhesin, head GIN domain